MKLTLCPPTKRLMTSDRRRSQRGLIAIFALLTASAAVAQQDYRAQPQSFDSAAHASPVTPLVHLPQLTADEVVARLLDANTHRARALQGYAGTRVYNIDYHGLLGHKFAGLTVAVKFTAPFTKEFTIVSETGSKMIQTKVLNKLLESEKEAANPESQRRTALSPENYKFALLGTAPSANGGCYRLHVDPLHDNKFLYRGEICVNAVDFAVESIDAEPSKNPSFWISSTKIEHHYQKVGEFWLPASNKSLTKVRLGGSATLTIQYSDYRVVPANVASR
jgi:hypothetical protein